MSGQRKPNPWLDAALKFGTEHESFVALDPRTNPKAWAAWRDYFRWLNWAPQWFVAVEREHDEHRDSPTSWTAPIDHPDRFTVSFQPVKGAPPVFPLTLPKPAIGALAGHIDRLRRESKLTFGDPRDDDRRKPWFKSLSKSAAQATLDRYEREAAENLAYDEV